jgi:outer membrane protein TolC
MHQFPNFSIARVAAVITCALAFGAHAADGPLDLREAAELAVQHQPLLTGLDAQARAAREASVASAQLPDPRLFGGIRDLPVTTQDAYSLSDDSDTQLVVGVSQEFPRAAKRRLRGEQREREAQRLDAERRAAELAIRRDASLAWLECWRDEAAKNISIDTLGAAQLQAQAAAIAVRSGAATQSDYVLALLNVERLRDGVAARDQALDQARFGLERWIGGAAQRPLALQEPQFAPAPTESIVLERLGAHPELDVLQQRINESQANIDVAKASRQPDWRVEFGYGYRHDYSDMVTLQVGMDLPLFAGNRQNRDVASASAMSEATAAQWDDGKRRLEARVLAANRNIEQLNRRLAAYNDTIAPQTENAIEAATAAWRSGRGTLGQVFDARRIRLDVLLARLDLQYDALKSRVELDYLAGG